MTHATKTYFRQPDTVARWWYPENASHPLYAHFSEQLHWVIAQQPWQGQRILDISTGKGRFAVNLAAHGADVTALDIAPQMLALAQRSADEQGVAVQFLQADAEHLPFPTASFDVVLCMEAIMHVPHPQRLLHEMARTVRPGGVVILSMTNRWRLNALGEAPGALYRWLGLARSAAVPRYMWHYSVPQFTHFITQAGLHITQLHGQGLFQANARLWLNSEISVPLFPRWFADTFFAQIEPFLRDTPLRNIMGTVMAVGHKDA